MIFMIKKGYGLNILNQNFWYIYSYFTYFVESLHFLLFFLVFISSSLEFLLRFFFQNVKFVTLQK